MEDGARTDPTAFPPYVETGKWYMGRREDAMGTWLRDHVEEHHEWSYSTNKSGGV